MDATGRMAIDTFNFQVDELQLKQGNRGIENSHSIIFIDEQRGMYHKFQYQHLYQKVLSNCRCFSKYYVIAFNFEKKISSNMFYDFIRQVL